MDNERTVRVGLKEGLLLTTFQPPISENKLFEAMTSAFSFRQTVRDRENHQRIWAIVYEMGKPEVFDENIAKLQREIEENTSYSVVGEVLHLGSAAVSAAAGEVA